ncbi:MAG: hypothetical protein L6437_15160 [Kiritimatiellae bacterium]|nr:hypothetical protein [Kiritimatiellia bacterium]
MDPITPKSLFADDSLGAVFTDQNSLPGFGPGLIECLGNLGRILELNRQFVYFSHEARFFRVRLKVLCRLVVRISNGNPAPVPLAMLGAFVEFVRRALCREFAFELAEAQKHVQREHPHRRGRIEILRRGYEFNVMIFKLLPELVEIR